MIAGPVTLIKSFVLSCLRACARAVPALGTLLRPLIGGAYERVPDFSASDDTDDTALAINALESSRTAGLHARGRSPGLSSNNGDSRTGERSLSTSVKPGTMRLGGSGRTSVPPAPRSTSVGAGSGSSPSGTEAISSRLAQDQSPPHLPARSPSPVTASDWDESEAWEEDAI